VNELTILEAPHATLLKVCEDATPSPELSMLLHAMVDTLKTTPNAIGLAAPQVGVSIRAFVMGTEAQGYLALVNPRIVKRSGIKILSSEECLSVPGKTVIKRRSATITVRGLDAEGASFEFTAKGRAACVIQHEMDHLDGKLIS
jgi:peptide deformylase